MEINLNEDSDYVLLVKIETFQSKKKKRRKVIYFGFA